jgi:hypothetical protein
MSAAADRRASPEMNVSMEGSPCAAASAAASCRASAARRKTLRSLGAKRHRQKWHERFRNPEPRGRGGRREGFRPDLVDQVGPSVRLIARRLGVSKSTVHNWMRRHPEFRQALVRESVRREIQRLQKSQDKINRALQRLKAQKRR